MLLHYCIRAYVKSRKRVFSIFQQSWSWTFHSFSFNRFTLKYLLNYPSINIFYISIFLFSQSFEKRLLASPCPSIRSCWTNRLSLDGFWLNLIFDFFFRKFVWKMEVSLKSDKNNWYSTWRHFTFMTVSRWIILRVRNISNKSCRENQNKYVYYVRWHFFPNIMPFMSKNVVETERLKMAIWLRVVCCISKATRTGMH